MITRPSRRSALKLLAAGGLATAAAARATGAGPVLHPQTPASAPDSPAQAADRARRIKWWHDARFGMFIHWGVYSVIGRHEWVMENEAIPVAEYEQFARRFQPKPNAARDWAKLARRAGQKYMVMTTKHHEGFCLFDTQTTSYCAPKQGPGRDLVREYVDAARAEGLRVGFYYSLMDWHHPDGARCATDEAARRLAQFRDQRLHPAQGATTGESRADRNAVADDAFWVIGDRSNDEVRPFLQQDCAGGVLERLLDGLHGEIQQPVHIVLGVDLQPNLEDQVDIVLQDVGVSRSVVIHETPAVFAARAQVGSGVRTILHDSGSSRDDVLGRRRERRSALAPQASA